MIRTVLFAVLLLAAQVLSLPVTNPTTKDDTKVMKCIVEVISDTVSKPNPLPLSQECLEILQGDERILSILRHQNLLKELQEIAIQGASERTEQQKKNSGFEDELSEVLESQSDKNTERDLEGASEEEPTASFAELEAEKSQKNREKDVSKEDERNSLEERDPRAREVYPEDEKENSEDFKSNEVSKREELSWDDAVDNHIHDDIREDELPGQRHQSDEEAAGMDGTDDFEDEREHVSKNSQEEGNEEIEDRVRDQTEEEEDEDEEEEERGTSEEEHPTSTEDEDYQREDENEGSKGFEKDEKPPEEKDKEKYHNVKGGGRHRSLDETTQAEDTSHARDVESDEMDEEPSKDVEDAKRWNKMDELAKQLTTAKRMEENESNEDPDGSMKQAFRSHKYDFRNPEDDVRRAQKHHSKEESSEGGFPLIAMPEEKKDEEGSANRRTEHISPAQKFLADEKDQELESLAAIEAELEKVAHKLHALRKA